MSTSIQYLKDLLANHQKLLEVRGYSESVLNSPFKQGTFFRALQQHVCRANKYSFWDSSPVEFSIQAVSFYQDDQKHIRFQFRYQYHPETSILKILSISAYSENSQRTFFLKSNQELPKSEDIRNFLHNEERARMRTLKLSRIVATGNRATRYKRPAW